MKKLKGLDLIDYAIESGVDFLAFAVSPWHMLGVQAVIEKLTQSDDFLRGIVAICKNGNGLYTIAPELYAHMHNVEFIYYDSSISKDSRVLDAVGMTAKTGDVLKGRKFFIIPYKIDVFLCSYYIKRQKEKRVECYVIDEGLGTYTGMKRTNFEGKGACLANLKEKIVDFIIERYGAKLLRNQIYNDFSILRLDSRYKWVENEGVVKYYRKVLEKKQVKEIEDSQMYSNALLINTQPFMGVGIPKDDVDIDILLKLCRQCKKNNISVVIKPHPGQRDLHRYEALTEYAYFDLRKELTQEEILSSLENKPRAIVAFSSTTLLTCKLFYGIQAYSLASILIEKNICESHKEGLNTFIHAFENQIYFYKSVDEIVDAIREIEINNREMDER